MIQPWTLAQRENAQNPDDCGTGFEDRKARGMVTQAKQIPTADLIAELRMMSAQISKGKRFFDEVSERLERHIEVLQALKVTIEYLKGSGRDFLVEQLNRIVAKAEGAVTCPKCHGLVTLVKSVKEISGRELDDEGFSDWEIECPNCGGGEAGSDCAFRKA